MKKAIVTAAAALAAGASAQSGPWAQCGGINWTGATTCVAGWHCVYQNDWYSQCLQGSGTTAATTTAPTTTTLVTSTRTSTTSRPTYTGTSTFATTSGGKFVIDGKTGYFAGANCYWCSFLTSSADVGSTFDHLVSSGLKILRIWGFNDITSAPSSGQVYFQHLSSSGSTINTGPTGLGLLDNAVAAAEARGLKLIINFVNNWDDYGGISAYVTAFGGTRTSWYTNTAAQTQYKKYIEAVVSRYKNSTAIFAWELANEPRCNGCDTNVIYNWATQISAYIKSLDSNHMVTLGDEGFGLNAGTSYPYQFGEGLDFAKNLQIPNLDFGTFHLYPQSWGVDFSFGSSWVTAHGTACAAAGKPCMLEEYGATTDHCTNEAPWQDAALKSGTVSSDLFWQWGDTFSWGSSHNDGHTIYYGSSDWVCLVQDHVADIAAAGA